MRTKISLITLWFIMAALIIAMPVSIIHAAGSEITIKGSTTILPVAQVASEVFMEKNPGIKKIGRASCRERVSWLV